MLSCHIGCPVIPGLCFLKNTCFRAFGLYSILVLVGYKSADGFPDHPRALPCGHCYSCPLPHVRSHLHHSCSHSSSLHYSMALSPCILCALLLLVLGLLLIVGFVGRWRQGPKWITPPTHHSCCSAALERNKRAHSMHACSRCQ